MAEAISDCQVLLRGGMGMGAYENLQQLGIRPMVVQEESIEAAVAAFLAGSLQNQPDLLH
jgi:predicted Fe-Mo cluster-binding NifX family protein